jgi:gliding motility-associated-like protein
MYEWSPKEGLSDAGISDPIASPDSTTTYAVKVTDVKGCVNYDTVTVTIVEPEVWTPSAFTPNGDGRNDVFYVRGRGFETFELVIFNRWGEQVFQTNDPNQGWDGSKQGSLNDMPSDAYVYVIRATLSNGERVNEEGMVNLIR